MRRKIREPMVGIRVTHEEKKLLEEIATVSGNLNLTDWARPILLREARRVKRSQETGRYMGSQPARPTKEIQKKASRARD